MSERAQEFRATLADVDVVERVIVPALASVVAMAVGFTAVGVTIMLQESVIRDSTVMSYLALAVMFLIPPFAAGLYLGRRQGAGIGPALAAGIAPIVVLILALGAFGGPMATPLQAPVYTLVAVAVWSILCACGMVAWTTLLGPRVGESRATPGPDA
jgi:hypothetical protein